MSNDEHLRYPIGKFSAKEVYTTDDVKANIQRIQILPSVIEGLAMNLSVLQLNSPYREGGWTARQVLHHLADSHMNAYIRIKWMLTESTPTIKAYDEKAWAETPEVQANPSLSIALLKALHAKWTVLLQGISLADYGKQFYHPDSHKHVRVDQVIATYAWHGEHHAGHLKIVAGKL